MKTWLILTPLVLLGCDSTRQDTTPVAIPLALPDGDTLCFALRVVNAQGEATFERGAPTLSPATVADAVSAGALCIHEDTVVDSACDAGPGEARLWMLGYYRGGERLDDFVSDPCGPSGCAKAFECTAGGGPRVTFELTLLREAHQGFFDVWLLHDAAPEGVPSLCYSVRVADGQGTVVSGRRDLCSDAYGNGPGGDVTYVFACNAKAPEHVVTVWVHTPEGAAASFENACPAPQGGDLESWSGGCSQTVTCIENEDAEVRFELRGAE